MFLSAEKPPAAGRGLEGHFPLLPLLYFYWFNYLFIRFAKTSGSLFQRRRLTLDSHTNRFPLISLFFYPAWHKADRRPALFLLWMHAEWEMASEADPGSVVRRRSSRLGSSGSVQLLCSLSVRLKNFSCSPNKLCFVQEHGPRFRVQSARKKPLSKKQWPIVFVFKCVCVCVLALHLHTLLKISV